MAVKELSDGGSEGTRLGQSASDLIAFHGASPTDQYAAITSPAATAATNSTPYGYSQAQADAIVTAVNSILAVLREKGIIASA